MLFASGTVDIDTYILCKSGEILDVLEILVVSVMISAMPTSFHPALVKLSRPESTSRVTYVTMWCSYGKSAPL